MSLIEAGCEECFLCKKKLDSDKKGVEWFVLGHVDYEAVYGLYRYSGSQCHYSCYNNWEYKDVYNKEVEREKKYNEELNKRLDGLSLSERDEIMKEEVRLWNEKVRRNKYSFEWYSEEEDMSSGDYQEIDYDQDIPK